MTSAIQQDRGRIVDSPGDNILAEFASVVDPTECAVKIQEELKKKIVGCLLIVRGSFGLASTSEMLLKMVKGSMEMVSI